MSTFSPEIEAEVRRILEKAAQRILDGFSLAANGDQRERLLTSREVAEFLNVSPATIMRWHSDGKLPGYRLPSRALRFREQDIVDSLKSDPC